MGNYEIIELSGLEMQILEHVSRASAAERMAGEEGWICRPPEVEKDYARAIDRLVLLEVFETSAKHGAEWLRPTNAGESMLAQAQAAFAEKQ